MSNQFSAGKNKSKPHPNTLTDYQLGKTEHDMAYVLNEDGSIKFVSGSFGKVKQPVTQKNISQAKKTKIKTISHHFVVCPLCKRTVSKKKLDAHIQKEHQSKQVEPQLTPSAPSSFEFICPICHANIKTQGKFEKHLVLVHNQKGQALPNKLTVKIPEQKPESLSKKQTIRSNSNRPQEPEIICPICKAKIRSQHRLDRHLFKVHHESTQNPAITKISPPDKQVRPQQRSSDSSEKWLKDEVDAKYLKDAFDQSFDEPIYGGKGLGHMEREWDGKFGSLPLFDPSDDDEFDND